MNVLLVGPSLTKSKGGMVTVINGIVQSECMKKKKININSYASYIDGSKFKVILYSVYSIIKFFFSFSKKYDLYHIHMASNGSAIRKLTYGKILDYRKKPYIYHIHGGGYIEFFNKQNNKRRKKITDSLNKAKYVIALSEDWREKFVTVLGLNNCVVLQNGINDMLYTKSRTDIKNTFGCLLALSRMNENKGTYDLINTIETLSKKNLNIHLYLAGDGEIETVKKVVNEKGLGKIIDVIGWVDLEEKIELLKRVSILVLPSYHEALPMSILEAMASGKAIISTTVGAIPEIVSEENGILINPGDIDALSRAIENLVKDIEMVACMGKNNIEKIEKNYGITKMHNILIEYYNNALNV